MLAGISTRPKTTEELSVWLEFLIHFRHCTPVDATLPLSLFLWKASLIVLDLKLSFEIVISTRTKLNLFDFTQKTARPKLRPFFHQQKTIKDIQSHATAEITIYYWRYLLFTEIFEIHKGLKQKQLILDFSFPNFHTAKEWIDKSLKCCSLHLSHLRDLQTVWNSRSYLTFLTQMVWIRAIFVYTYSDTYIGLDTHKLRLALSTSSARTVQGRYWVIRSPSCKQCNPEVI